MIRELKNSFGSKQVLSGLNLDVFEGESLVIIGASGTGKSVLMKNIVGILRPNSGSIKIDGEECVDVTNNVREKINRKLGMLFQGAALFDSLRLWENVAFGLISLKISSREEARIKAIDQLKKVGLSETDADRYPRRFQRAPKSASALPVPLRPIRKSCSLMNQQQVSTQLWAK